MLTQLQRHSAAEFLAALNDLESPDVRKREIALRTIHDFSGGLTLPEVVWVFIARALESTPPWQISARAILATAGDDLNPVGRAFCERLARRKKRPRSEDQRLLDNLFKAVWGR